MEQNRFDDLTRALAGSTSRRQVLKLLGGGLLAALVPGSVLAKGGGNSACANFCAQVFGANTKGAGQCTSDAAKGKGLCYQCGPKSDGSKRVCGTTCIDATQPCNGICPSGYKLCNSSCISVNDCCGACTTTCATCQSGTCACPPGTVMTANGTCATPCDANTPCRCIETNEGNFCSNGSNGSTCNRSNSDCPAGSLCSGVLCESAC